MNLLPKPPFVLHYNSLCKRRWLYPADFVEALAEIASCGVIGKRMDHDKWWTFEQMVDEAEAEFITPLLGPGVTGPIHLRLVRRGRAGTSVDSGVDTAAISA